MLDPYKALRRATCSTQHPRLRATRLLEMLREPRLPGLGRRSCAATSRTVRPDARAEAYLRLETLPGEQGQVDWGHFGKIHVGARRRARCRAS